MNDTRFNEIEELADDDDVPGLIRKLENPDIDDGIRAGAAQLLGNLGNPLAESVLQEALLDNNRDVRLEAALALGRLVSITSVDLLHEFLENDPDDMVQCACAIALGFMGDDRAIEPLRSTIIRFYNHPNENRLVGPFGDKTDIFLAIAEQTLCQFLEGVEFCKPVYEEDIILVYQDADGRVFTDPDYSEP